MSQRGGFLTAKRRFCRQILFLGAAGAICFAASFSMKASASLQISSRLLYDRQNRGPVPLPPAERNLQNVEASSWFQVSKENHLMAGSVFDDKGNLFFCDKTARKVLRLTPKRQLSTVTELKKFQPSGLAFAPDGRLFIAAFAEKEEKGAIFALHLEKKEAHSGDHLEIILDESSGYVPKNIAFHPHGGFYFTDYKGTSGEPAGGVYYVQPDQRSIDKIIDHLALPSGLMLSPDQKYLWIAEAGKNRLHKVVLETPFKPALRGASVLYYFTGPPPDSISSGSDGNVYVAMNGQGRILILNHNALPLGQILLFGRSRGHNLFASSLAIRPGGKDLYILGSDGEGGWGSSIFKQTSYGHGVAVPPFNAH